MKNKIKYIFIFLIIVISLFLLKAFFKPGFYSSHDGHHQLIRMAVFDQGLKDGQFPVRWAGSAYHKYGYPLFIFTYRTPFIIGEFFRGIIGLSYMWTIKSVFLLTYAGSGITMFLFLNHLADKKWKAFIGTLFYQIAPYRFSNIFVRGALGEATIFMFLPLIFLSIHRLEKKQAVNIVLGAVALALALMSHAMVFYLFLPFILLYYLYFFIRAEKKLLYVKKVFLQGLLSLGVSAYYWLPALIAKQNIVFNEFIKKIHLKHFPTLKQIIYSPWGFGFSMPGVEGDMMSFQLGIGQWAVLGFATFFFLYQLLKKQSKRTELGILSLFLTALAIFMSLKFSIPVWKILVKGLAVDFPWRYLSAAVFFSSIAATVFLSGLKDNAALMAAILLVPLLVYSNRNHLGINKTLVYPDEELVRSVDTSNSYAEYAPKQIRNEEVGEADPFFQDKSGDAEYELVKKDSDEAVIKAAVASEKASVLLKTTYFPGWKVTVNGEKSAAEEEKGRIKLTLPKGEHQVRVHFKGSKPIIIANYLSFFTISSCLILLLIRRFN
jgi:hypothetical protein